MDDVIVLISHSYTKDTEGYETDTEIRREVFCHFQAGVSQNEFYLSHKEGFQASASVDIFEADYQKEKEAEFRGDKYRVIRMFQRQMDYVTLILEEVER